MPRDAYLENFISMLAINCSCIAFSRQQEQHQQNEPWVDPKAGTF